MRADFILVSSDRRAHQDWSDGDVGELGELIRGALDSGDTAAIEAWAEYLSVEAQALRLPARACRDAEARIRAACAVERERQQQGAA